MNKLVQNYQQGLRLEFIHLYEHKFQNNIKDTLDRFCSCNIEAETISSVFQCNPRKFHEWLNEHWQIPPMTESK